MQFIHKNKVFDVHGSVHCNNILIYIRQDAALHSLFYLETALYVSGGTITHNQERKQLYLQHLVFVTPLLLSATIVEELKLVWVCCGWCMPPITHSNWIELAEDRDGWQALVNVVMNRRVSQNVGNLLTSWKPVSFWRRTLLHGASQCRIGLEIRGASRK
jgi:hypothetical protein